MRRTTSARSGRTSLLNSRTWDRVRDEARERLGRNGAGTDLLLALLCAVVVTAPLLARGTPDEETYEFSIFSTLYFARALLAGTDPFFAPDVAFGVQLPNGQWFLKFPASVAAVFGSARVLYVALWLSGQTAFAFFLLRLLRRVSASPAVRLVALLTAALSFSNLGYFHVDDWPEVFLAWCLIPFCLWTSVGLIEAYRTGGERIGPMALCAVAFGLLVGNGHPLHSFIWFTVLMLFFVPMVAATPRLLPILGAVAVVAGLGALDVVVQTLAGLGSSHGTFDPLQDTVRYPSLDAAAYLAFLQPLPAVAARGWEGLTTSVFGRRPFYGAVFFGLAMAGSTLALWRPRLLAVVPNAALVRAFGIAFLGTVVLTFAPSWALLNLVGEGWHYKDGQTIFAIVMAAMVLDTLRQRGWRRLAAALLVVQAVQVVAVAAPIVSGGWRNDRPLLFARGERGGAFWRHPSIAALRGTARVLAAGSLDTELFSNLRAADGIVAVTDFALEDIALVNAWYRGTVTPNFASTGDPRYGAYQTILRWSTAFHHLDRAALDGLGITHVLVLASERDTVQEALGLEPAGIVEEGLTGAPIAVLRNPRAWDRAVLIAPGGPADLAPRRDCPEPYVWCADFSDLAANRVAGTRVRRHGSTFIVDLPAGHPGGSVLLTQVLANGWSAEVDGRPQPARPFHGVFTAVDVGTSARVVTLRHGSRTQAVMLAIGSAQLAICLALYAAVTLRRSRAAHAR